MKTSEKIDQIIPAFLKAQQEMTAARKDSKNPHFKSNYADYTAVSTAVKEPLNKNGIAFVQPIIEEDGKQYVQTVLLHTSGQWLSSQTEIKIPNAHKENPQKMGSAITYARRYDLSSICGLETEDDDGNGAAAPVKNKAYQPQPKPAQPKRLTEAKILNFQKGVKDGKTEEVEKMLKAFAVSTDERNRIFNA